MWENCVTPWSDGLRRVTQSILCRACRSRSALARCVSAQSTTIFETPRSVAGIRSISWHDFIPQICLELDVQEIKMLQCCCDSVRNRRILVQWGVDTSADIMTCAVSTGHFLSVPRYDARDLHSRTTFSEVMISWTILIRMGCFRIARPTLWLVRYAGVWRIFDWDMSWEMWPACSGHESAGLACYCVCNHWTVRRVCVVPKTCVFLRAANIWQQRRSENVGRCTVLWSGLFTSASEVCSWNLNGSVNGGAFCWRSELRCGLLKHKNIITAEWKVFLLCTGMGYVCRSLSELFVWEWCVLVRITQLSELILGDCDSVATLDSDRRRDTAVTLELSLKCALLCWDDGDESDGTDGTTVLDVDICVPPLADAFKREGFTLVWIVPKNNYGLRRQQRTDKPPRQRISRILCVVWWRNTFCA